MNQTNEQSEISADLDTQLNNGNLSLSKLKEVLQVYADIQFPTLPQMEISDKLLAYYCEGMIDKTEMNKYFINVCEYLNLTYHENDKGLGTSLELQLPLLESKHTFSDMLLSLFAGNLIMYWEGAEHFYAVNVSKIPQRSLQESNTEISIKGPKDAFTEDLYLNMSLIRKRLHTDQLYSEQFIIGSISNTKTILLYLNHKANSNMIAEARKRLETIQLESLNSSGQLEQWLSDRSFSIFPLIDYIGRPDFVVDSLLRGRFAIIVEGSPMVLIAPSNFFELLKSPEDVHTTYYLVIFQRALRIVGLLLSVFLPGFWIAFANVNLDQIPFTLLATVNISRDGVPLPTFLEAFLLLFQFELLREAGVRLPKAVGQTIGIVGGLIIGESLIRAGLASPTLLVVIAVSVVATFSLVNQSLSGTVSILRFFILLVSAFLGVYGFLFCMFLILIYLCKLNSFGMNYLEPITSLKLKDILTALLYDPFRRSYSSSVTRKYERRKKR